MDKMDKSAELDECTEVDKSVEVNELDDCTEADKSEEPRGTWLKKIKKKQQKNKQKQTGLGGIWKSRVEQGKAGGLIERFHFKTILQKIYFESAPL